MNRLADLIEKTVRFAEHLDQQGQMQHADLIDQSLNQLAQVSEKEILTQGFDEDQVEYFGLLVDSGVEPPIARGLTEQKFGM